MNNLQSEISEQQDILGHFNHEDITKVKMVAKKISDVAFCGGNTFLFGSGSSLNACFFGRELFSRDNDLILEVFPAGGVINHVDDIKNGDLVILVSKSGESKDALNVKKEIERLKKMQIEMVLITNNPNSTLAKGIDIVLDMKVGEEKAMPATKSYFASLVLFIMISEAIKGKIEILEVKDRIESEIEKILTVKLADMKIDEFINKYIFILGSGVLWPQAMEAELKLKEIAKAEARGYETSEFFHGPNEMLNKNSLVILFCSKNCHRLEKKPISEIEERRAKLIVVSNLDCEKVNSLIKIDENKYFGLICIVVIQKMALMLANSKNIRKI